jgi:hypothetical protein
LRTNVLFTWWTRMVGNLFMKQLVVAIWTP